MELEDILREVAGVAGADAFNGEITDDPVPDAIERITALFTRPTAGLGEDGELVKRVEQIKAERKRYYDVEGDAVDVLLTDLRDRLILYREALEEAVAALGQVNVRCFDREESPLKPLGDIAREALAGICKKLGNTAYDDIARAVLSRSGG